MTCYTESYFTDCGKRYFYVPLLFSSELENPTSLEINPETFFPNDFCKDFSKTICVKPKQVTFRRVELVLNNSQLIKVEIPFKFTEIDFVNLLQTWKSDNRVVKVSYFGEIIRPHPIFKICQ